MVKRMMLTILRGLMLLHLLLWNFFFGRRLVSHWRGDPWPFVTLLGDVTNPVGMVMLETTGMLWCIGVYLWATRRLA